MQLLAILLIASVCGISCSRTLPSADDFQPETIVALERGDHGVVVARR